MFSCVFGLYINYILSSSNKFSNDTVTLFYLTTEVLHPTINYTYNAIMEDYHRKLGHNNQLYTLNNCELLEQFSKILIKNYKIYLNNYLKLEFNTINFRHIRHITYLVQKNTNQKIIDYDSFHKYIEISRCFFDYLSLLIIETLYSHTEILDLNKTLTIVDNVKSEKRFENANTKNIYLNDTYNIDYLADRIMNYQEQKTVLNIDLLYIINSYFRNINYLSSSCEHLKIDHTIKYISNAEKHLLLNTIFTLIDKMRLSEMLQIQLIERNSYSLKKIFYFMSLKIAFAKDLSMSVQQSLMDTYGYVYDAIKHTIK